ncbi:MAG TPA: DNA repair protein RecN [Bacillota bacterium]|nr:DNA repair protein RecN [Bacillota bacterium]
MITHLSIKNFAIISDIDIDFYKGLNIMTGETGAGKSIVIEAMNIALGGRADRTFIRTGCDKAVVQLVASHINTETVVTRELYAEGKSLCRIDGEIVSLAQLNEYCQKITDVHGQYAHQSLLDPGNHITLIDSYEKESIVSTKKRVSELYDDFSEVSKRLAEIHSSVREEMRKKDYMEFELKEIKKAALVPGEEEKLKEQLDTLKYMETVSNNMEKAYMLAREDENSPLESLGAIQNILKEIAPHSKDASELENDFHDIYYRLEDICTRLRQAKEKIIFSSSDLDELSARLDLIETMKRKYGDDVEQILDHASKLEKALSIIENLDTDTAALNLEKSRIEDMLKDETRRLSSLRKAAANTLEEKINKELLDLNFQDAQISIAIKPLSGYTANGTDDVEFLIKTNKGSDFKPLAKIASGGEMSRIMLAFKTVIGDYDDIPTMVFDEIDSGISGATASVVGKKLMELAGKHQIISITHLPQIAACGDHNFRIEKKSSETETFTTIKHLSEKEKVNEIARLLSGSNVSDLSVKSAKELIELSQ